MEHQHAGDDLDVPIYKYLSSQFADNLAGGSFRIGNARLCADYLTIECPQAAIKASVNVFAPPQEIISTPHSHIKHITALVRLHLYSQMVAALQNSAQETFRQNSRFASHNQLEDFQARSDRQLYQAAQEKAVLGNIFRPLAVHYWNLRVHFGGTEGMDDALEHSPLSLWHLGLALQPYISHLVSSKAVSHQELLTLTDEVREQTLHMAHSFLISTNP